MSSCEQVQELISRMLDEELTPTEAEVLRRHRESCPDCAAMYAAFHALSESLSQDLEEPPASLRENVMAELRREEIRQKHSRRSVWPQGTGPGHATERASGSPPALRKRRPSSGG